MKEDNTRLKMVVKSLNQKGLNGLIIYSGGACNILRPSFLQYLCEYRPLKSNNAAIISRNGDIVLLVEPSWDTIRVAKNSWVSDVRGSSDFLRDLRNIMKEFNITGSVGLINSKEMTYDLYSVVKNQADIQVSDTIIEEIARDKTEKEIDGIRKVAGIADKGFEALLQYTRIGIREYELVAEMEFAMRAAGADDIFILLSSGKHNYEMHEPTDRRLREEDIIIGEITPGCGGQFIQLCRTVVLGKSNPILSEKYEMLLRAFEAAIQQIKAGAPASGMSVAMNRVISDAGYPEYCKPPYMRARGHGFGVGSIAPGGVIHDDIKTDFEAKQVVVVHPNQYLPETGYLACGETVMVTDTNVERLAETETKLYVKEV
jgi:Xaa-Pro dipeptidase